MFAFFVIAALAAVSSGLPLDSPAKGQVDNGRIVGGKATTIDQYPYQVILEYTDHSISCGGSIIAKNVVLTAAHCADGLYGPNYGRLIRAGTSYPGKGGSLHTIKKVTVHEDYSSSALVNDVALIFVNEPFEIDSSHKPIGLRNSSEEIPAGALATISGFGRLRSGGSLPKQLQVAQLPIVAKDVCDEAYYYYGGIGYGQICAGIYGEGGKDTCQGDSGGPLVVDDQLAGIVSYGVGCAEPYYPGVYTEVAYFYDWIVENAGLSA